MQNFHLEMLGEVVRLRISESLGSSGALEWRGGAPGHDMDCLWGSYFSEPVFVPGSEGKRLNVTLSDRPNAQDIGSDSH